MIPVSKDRRESRKERTEILQMFGKACDLSPTMTLGQVIASVFRQRNLQPGPPKHHAYYTDKDLRVAVEQWLEGKFLLPKEENKC